MNAERLHIVALTLNQELTGQNVIGTLQNLVNSLQSIVQSSNVNTQHNLVSSRDGFYAAVTDTRSDSFTPAWRQILVEMGGEELFGKNLKQRVQQILADNQMTPGVAQQQLGDILSKLQAFKKGLEQLVTAFEHFSIGSEKLGPGEAEITLLIPREAVHDKLEEFTEELEEMKFILNTLSEVATGHKDDLKIRTVSSSGLMLFLAASPAFGAIVAKAVDYVVGTYKKILEIKKLQLEIERLQLPEEISEKTKAHANTLMEAEIEKFTIEIVNEYHTGKDGGRKNELTNAVKISLNKIANRIDRGFNFEVRIEPPKPLPQDAKEASEVKQAVQTIQVASVNMQYMKLEGPPILALPEDIESAADGEGKHKKRGTAAKKDEPK
jgi:hypothetical protein